MNKISVTGGNSFLGERVCQVLFDRGYSVDPILHSECDLLNIHEVDRRFKIFQPDAVIHLACYSGNIQFNQICGEETFYRTTQIGINVLNSCSFHKIPRVVSILSSCAIGDSEDILTEDHLYKNAPHPSIEPHGAAKRNLEVYTRIIRKQSKLDYVTCILQNLFGEKDSTDLAKTKVVMSLIKKYVHAKEHNYPSVTNWGSGIAKRELLYVKDAAEAIAQVIEKYNEPDPINITSDYEITIKELADKISSMVGYNGETLWDTTKSDGQLRKKLSSVKMKKYLDVKFTDFDIALKNTINWYNSISWIDS